MDPIKLNAQIEALKIILQTEEENYKTALTMYINFDSLKQIRGNIRKLKDDIKILSGKEWFG